MPDTDLLYGVPAIARFIGLKDRQVYHLKDHGLPTFRIGRKVCARKGKLTEWLQSRERGEGADQPHNEQGVADQQSDGLA